MTTYRVMFRQIDFDFTQSKHDVYFANIANAVHMAKILSKCSDVLDTVDVVDTTTGEVLYTAENGDTIYAVDDIKLYI